MRTLIDRIEREMQTDTESREKQSQYLLHLYHGTDDAGRRLLDEAVVCLCGSAIATLLGAGDDVDEEEEEEEEDGASGQDRDSYSDTQDRDSYTVDPDDEDDAA